MPANRRRGEVAAMIDGREHILCLTLGALAELEAAFAVDDLSALTERFSGGRLSSHDLVRVIGAGLRGAGANISDEEVAGLRFDGATAGCAALVGELLSVTFGTEEVTESAAHRP